MRRKYIKDKSRELEKLYKEAKVEVKEYRLQDLLGKNRKKTIKCDAEYHRNFIWDNVKASNLVETVILNAIVPPFIVMEDQDEIIIIDQ